MSSHPQQNAQSSIPANLPAPLPPGPVPAPAPRDAGDIPDPPLNAAVSTSKRRGATVYEVVTDRIISHLEQGTVPWRADWVRSASVPVSLATGKPYRGINRFLLPLIAHAAGYAAPFWLTFKQVTERGGKVRKGEKGSPCFFWKVYDQADIDHADVGADDDKKRFVARYYTVFNVEQCDGIDYPKPALPDPATSGATPIEAAEQIVSGFHGPTIMTKGQRPCYLPASDTVEMPARATFFTPEGYYSTLFHEMIHATGHSSRLARITFAPAPFGSTDYSREELIAELGSAFLCSEAKISPAVIENQAAYLSGWLNVLKADRRAIVVAAAQAEKAANLVLGISTNPAE